jgi:hypothetical protein
MKHPENPQILEILILTNSYPENPQILEILILTIKSYIVVYG